MKLVGAHEDIRVLNNLHQALLSRHSKDFVVFLNKQGVSIEEANALVFLLKSIAFEVNQNELSLLSGTLTHERRYGSCWSNIEKMGVQAVSLRCDSKLVENITDVTSKSERIEKSNKSDKSNIEDFFKQLNLAKPPKNNIKVFSEEKNDKKEKKESVYDFLEKVCKGEYTDEKKARDAHKDAMNTKNGTSMFGFWTRPEKVEQVKKERIYLPQEEEKVVEEKITLTPVYTTFKEISKDKAGTENLRCINVKKKLDVMTESEIKMVVTPILKKIAKEIPYERQPVVFLLLKMIGETGWYTIKDFNEELQRRLKEETNETEKKKIEAVAGNPKAIQSQMFYLKESGLIESIDSAVSGGKGIPSKVYMLSNHGNILYTYLYKEDPVRSIYVTMAKSEKSIELQTNIKKAVDVLELNGFDCFLKDHIVLPDGRYSVCDILAQKNGNQFRIEVDDGMDSVKNYFEKFEKILIADNWLIFITPNKKVKKRLKEIFKEFVKQRIVDGLIGLKKANKKYIFLSIPELQSLPNKFYDKLVGKE